MLSFLLLVSTADTPLSSEHVAHLSRWPGAAIPHAPEGSRLWLAEGRRVGFVGWQSRVESRGGSHWHIGAHGLTAFGGSPWPADRTWPTDANWALDLTRRTAAATPEGLGHLAGGWTVLRLAPDGVGWITADAFGAGSVHVARHDGLVAISDRAQLAAAAVATATRACDVPALVDAGVQDPGHAWSDARTVPAGRWLHVAPGSGVELRGPEAADAMGSAVRADDIVRAMTVASRIPGLRLVDLDASAGAALVAAAIRASGTASRFRYRAVGDPTDRAAATRLAAVLGVAVDASAAPGGDGPLALDARLEKHLARTEAAVIPPLVASVVPSEAAAVVRASHHHATRRGRVMAAEEVLLEGPLRFDPLTFGGPGGSPEAEDLPALVTTLDPSGDIGPGDTPRPEIDRGWEHVGPLLELRLAATEQALDLGVGTAELLRDVRDDGGSPAVRRRAWAALTASAWLANRTVRPPERRLRRPATVRPSPLESPPTLITGVTSHSLPDLVELAVAPDERRYDALLGAVVDGPVADLCARILLSVDATATDLPPDLDRRLTARDTAGHAAAARDLLARRDGVLADARLGLLLPFWTAHVHPEPRVVLVGERPAELVAMSRSPVSATQLLGLWLDVSVRTLLGQDEVRVVDPRDIGDVDRPEGATPTSGQDSDPMRFASFVDGLVRELHLEDVRPLLRQVAAARSAAARPRPVPGPTDADDAALTAVAALWREVGRERREARHAADETAALAARVAELEDDLAELRSRPGVRLALRLAGRDFPSA